MSDIARLTTALADRYRVEKEAGRGGMATVFLAIDIRHERRVALKVLHPELAAVIGAERFLQEIKLTAALQHAHILPLHDSGSVDGLLFYVMPFVEGETLRDVLNREKQLEISRAVELTRQIAGALDYAHRQNIVHRDIKPENVLIHDGQALVADFGIALAMKSAGGTRMTETGLSLGTPQYMSPEQAMGDRELDARSDIYSLGAMLYEMLAGDPPYTGSTAQAIVAKVITEKPVPVTIHRDTVPPNVSAAIQKAISKLPADRFHSAAEFADALANPSFTTATASAELHVSAPRRGVVARLAWPVVAISLAAVAAWAWLRPTPGAPVARYGLLFPADQRLVARTWSTFGLARDGSWLAYVGPVQVNSALDQLWLKKRSQVNATPLAGTNDGWAPVSSPDNQWIAFLIGTEVRKLPLGGGAAIKLADSALTFDGSQLAWGDDEIVTYIDRAYRLRRVAASGGTATVAWTPPASRYAVAPTALPKGRGVLFGVCNTTCNSVRDVWVLDLKSGGAHPVVSGALQAWYVAGQLVYVRPDGAVLAQPFDLGALKTTGPAIPVLEGVQVTGVNPHIVIGGDGTLLYLAGASTAGANAEALWVGRDGSAIRVDSSWQFNPEGNAGWSLSPDGKRLAIKLSGADGGLHIWVKELDHGPVSRITFDSVGDFRPRWLSDGKTVSYISARGPGGAQSLFARSGDGTGQEMMKATAKIGIWESVWSRDGKWVVMRTGGVAGAQGDRDVYAMQIGVDTALRPILISKADERSISLSPDARWLAYVSDETGRDEVYVRTFPNVDAGKWQLSTAGGDAPLWAHSGRELFYRSAEQMMIAAQIGAGPTFTVSDRKTLFKVGSEYLSAAKYTPWDISPDDKRFIMVRNRGVQQGTMAPLVLVEHWVEELKAKTRR